MSKQNGNLLEFGEGFRLDPAKKILWHRGEIISLPLKSVELLCALLETPGEVVGKNALLEKVWGDAFVEESVLTQNIYLLRKTLEKKGERNLIKTVPRRGYLFKGEVSSALELKNAPDLIVERHLIEKIDVEEIENSDVENITPRRLPETTRKIPQVYFLTVAVVLLLAAIPAYFYFRGDSPIQKKNSAFFPVTASGKSNLKTLAILPFEIRDEREQTFAASFASDLSARLGSRNKFFVKPLAIVAEHQKHGVPLAADFILKGKIAVNGNRFAVSAELESLQNGEILWRKNFADADLIRLQDAISNETATTILNRLSPEEREQIEKRLPTNITAYEAFTNGLLVWRKRTGDSAPYFKRAIEMDQNFARAYLGLASAKMMGGKNSAPAAEAEELLKKAFELDSNSADAFAVYGFMRIFHQNDWQAAEKSLKTALQLDPNNVNAHHWLAVFHSIHRRLDEAKAEMQKAIELDPTNPTLHADMCQLRYFARESEAAIESCEKALAFEPNHVFVPQYLRQINQPQEPGDEETLLKELKIAAEQNSFTLPYINVDPRYDSLQDHPRFQEILRTMNLHRK